MSSSFTCPQCRRHLRGIPLSGRIDMACDGCGYRFRMIQGRIVGEWSNEAQQSSAGQSDDRATSLAMTVGVFTTVTIAFLMGFFEGGVLLALIAAILGGVASGFFFKRQMTPVVPVRYLTPDTRAAFATADQLRRARATLMQSRNAHGSALRGKQDLRRRLMGLRSKMEDLAIAAYAPRIRSIDAAVVTLDRQIGMDTLLRDGYDKSIKMIEIELEAGTAVDQMPEDIATVIAESMRELADLEATQAELTRQLEANVEVEQLLRIHTG